MKMLYVRLLVKKFDDCFEFYSNIMGFKITWGKKGDNYASFEVNGKIMISIFTTDLMNKHIGEPVLNRRVGDNHMVLIFDTDDVDEMYVQLKNKGVTFINEPHDMPGWGIRCVHLKDPEGNLIEINSILPKEKWSKGLLDNEPND